MQGKLPRRYVCQQGFKEALGTACGAGADGVAQRHLVAAHRKQRACYLEYRLRRDGAFVGAAKHTGNIAAYGNIGGLRPRHHRLEALQALGDTTVDVFA